MKKTKKERLDVKLFSAVPPGSSVRLVLFLILFSLPLWSLKILAAGP